MHHEKALVHPLSFITAWLLWGRTTGSQRHHHCLYWRKVFTFFCHKAKCIIILKNIVIITKHPFNWWNGKNVQILNADFDTWRKPWSCLSTAKSNSICSSKFKWFHFLSSDWPKKKKKKNCDSLQQLYFFIFFLLFLYAKMLKLKKALWQVYDCFYLTIQYLTCWKKNTGDLVIFARGFSWSWSIFLLLKPKCKTHNLTLCSSHSLRIHV